MPNDRRVARVAESIRREISQMLISGIKDDRVGVGMVSVTDVEVSGDLQHAKIFVSIYGTDEARAQTMEGLRSATGFVRSTIGQRVRLRRTPEILFVEDRSIERGTQVLSLLNRLTEERKASGRDVWEDTADAEIKGADKDADLEDADLEDAEPAGAED